MLMSSASRLKTGHFPQLERTKVVKKREQGHNENYFRNLGLGWKK